MNLYLLSLLIYSLMILPVSIHFRLRLGRRSGYRLEFRAAGLPLRRTGPEHLRRKRPSPAKKACGSCFLRTRRFCAP